MIRNRLRAFSGNLAGKGMRYLLNFISLLFDIVAVLIIAGLVFELIDDSERYDRMLFLAVVSLLLLLVGYFSRRIERQIRR